MLWISNTPDRCVMHFHELKSDVFRIFSQSVSIHSLKHQSLESVAWLSQRAQWLLLLILHDGPNGSSGPAIHLSISWHPYL